MGNRSDQSFGNVLPLVYSSIGVAAGSIQSITSSSANDLNFLLSSECSSTVIVPSMLQCKGVQVLVASHSFCSSGVPFPAGALVEKLAVFSKTRLC